jgi:hypothetical protein
MPKETIRKLSDDLGKLLTAGAHLASADPALAADKAKLEGLAKQFGDKAPVLGQLAKGIEKAIGSSGPDVAREICTLAAQAAQVRAAQSGLAPADGTPSPLAETAAIGTPCNARYVYDIHDALTKTGGGRDEPITNGIQTGQIVDLRLREAAIKAIGDNYLGQRVAKEVLPLFGPSIAKELRTEFDPKGGAIHGRRLSAVTAIEKAGAKDVIIRALQEGNAEMREVALDAIADHLVGVPEFEPLVLDTMQKERAAGVRRAGVRALEGFKSDATLDTLLDSLMLANCRQVAAHSLGKSPHGKVVDRLLALLDEQLAGKKKKKDDDTREQVRFVLKALAPHKDPRIAAKAAELVESHGAPAAECVLTSGDKKQIGVVADALFGKDWELFAPAVRAANALGPDESFKRLSKVFEAQDRNHDVGRRRISSVIHGLGKDADRRWLKVLFKEMDDPGPSSAQAIAAIGSIGDKSALKPLIKALGGQITTPIKSAIIQALGRLKDPSAIGPIFASIQDTKHHDVAGAVHYAILEIDSADALEPARKLVAGLKGTAWQFWYYRQMLERLERKFAR